MQEKTIYVFLYQNLKLFSNCKLVYLVPDLCISILEFKTGQKYFNFNKIKKIYVFLYQNLKIILYRQLLKKDEIYVFLYQNLKLKSSSTNPRSHFIYVFLYQNLKTAYFWVEEAAELFMYFYIRI